MNEMAMVEYLLKLYAKYEKGNDEKIISAFDCYIYYGKLELLEEIIQNRFNMQIEETDTEYRAYNSVCSVSVKK